MQIMSVSYEPLEKASFTSYRLQMYGPFGIPMVAGVYQSKQIAQQTAAELVGKGFGVQLYEEVSTMIEIFKPRSA